MTNPAMTKPNHHAPTQPGSDGDAVTLMMGDKSYEHNHLPKIGIIVLDDQDRHKGHVPIKIRQEE